jgi:hypothetical protein
VKGRDGTNVYAQRITAANTNADIRPALLTAGVLIGLKDQKRRGWIMPETIARYLLLLRQDDIANPPGPGPLSGTPDSGDQKDSGRTEDQTAFRPSLSAPFRMLNDDREIENSGVRQSSRLSDRVLSQPLESRYSCLAVHVHRIVR